MNNSSNPNECGYCGRVYPTAQARRGHQRHCQSRARVLATAAPSPTPAPSAPAWTSLPPTSAAQPPYAWSPPTAWSPSSSWSPPPPPSWSPAAGWWSPPPSAWPVDAATAWAWQQEADRQAWRQDCAAVIAHAIERRLARRGLHPDLIYMAASAAWSVLLSAPDDVLAHRRWAGDVGEHAARDILRQAAAAGW